MTISPGDVVGDDPEYAPRDPVAVYELLSAGYGGPEPTWSELAWTKAWAESVGLPWPPPKADTP